MPLKKFSMTQSSGVLVTEGVCVDALVVVMEGVCVDVLVLVLLSSYSDFLFRHFPSLKVKRLKLKKNYLRY